VGARGVRRCRLALCSSQRGLDVGHRQLDEGGACGSVEGHVERVHRERRARLAVERAQGSQNAGRDVTDFCGAPSYML
jgi:hypothetical protein